VRIHSASRQLIPVVGRMEPDPLHRAAPAAVRAHPAGRCDGRSVWRRHSTESRLPARQLLAEGRPHSPSSCCWASAAVVPPPGTKRSSTLSPTSRTAVAESVPGLPPLCQQFPIDSASRLAGADHLDCRRPSLGPDPGSLQRPCCRWRRTIHRLVHRSPEQSEIESFSATPMIRLEAARQPADGAGKLLPALARGGTQRQPFARSPLPKPCALQLACRRLSSWPRAN